MSSSTIRNIVLQFRPDSNGYAAMQSQDPIIDDCHICRPISVTFENRFINVSAAIGNNFLWLNTGATDSILLTDGTFTIDALNTALIPVINGSYYQIELDQGTGNQHFTSYQYPTATDRTNRTNGARQAISGLSALGLQIWDARLLDIVYLNSYSFAVSENSDTTNTQQSVYNFRVPIPVVVEPCQLQQYLFHPKLVFENNKQSKIVFYFTDVYGNVLQFPNANTNPPLIHLMFQ